MTKELRSVINDCFAFNAYLYKYGGLAKGCETMLEIPIDSDGIFELPCFVYKDARLFKNDSINSVVVPFCYNSSQSSFRSLDCALRDSLELQYKKGNLRKLPCAQGEDPYYCTRGIILDKNMWPVMIMSWQIKRVPTDDPLTSKFQLLAPILRVAPKVYLNKSNAVERYIVNKIIPAALCCGSIIKPSWACTTFFTGATNNLFHVRVEIGSSPFVLHEAERPSITTGNKQLLDLALKYIDDIDEPTA